MSLQSTMMKAAALYALKKATENVSEDDVKRWAQQAMDRTPAEWRSNALGALDTGLLRAGLMRASRAPNSASLVMTGMIAGVVVGAAAALLLAPTSGKEMRNKIAGFVGDILPTKTETESTTSASAIDSDGSSSEPATIGGTRVGHN